MSKRSLRRCCTQQLSVGVVFTVLAIFPAGVPLHAQDGTPAHGAAGPEVVVAEVVKGPAIVERTYVGTTAAANAVDLRARVGGYLIERRFTEGSVVEAGTPLFAIDPRSYQAVVDQRQAQLQEQQAVARYATTAQQRYAAAAKLGATAQDRLDQAIELQVKAEAAIAVYTAELEQAKLDLAFTEITAPIAGRIGRALVDVGALVKSDETVLATLVQMDPVYVLFSPPETDLPLIERARGTGPLDVAVTLPHVDEPRISGTLTFIDNVANAATGTIAMRATVAGPPEAIRPGQFARVHLRFEHDADALVVPARGISVIQGQPYVLVFGADKRVTRQAVRLGERTVDGGRIVEHGLRSGDRVVVSGASTLTSGDLVSLQPTSRP